jgi:excisionase family DNA binding protein
MAKLPPEFDPAAPLNGCEAVARYLHLSRGLVYEQARTGALPSLRIGSRLMIRTAALLQMIAAEQPAADDA